MSLYKSLSAKAFEVQVAIHELLGHGTGKLLYSEGQTYNGIFGSMASAYEECRAEAAGIYLCLCPEILTIFGHPEQDHDDIIYVNWLSMARAGFAALEHYTNGQWRQAHCQADFVILQVLIEAGVVIITTDSDNYHVSLDRDLIRTVGVPAIGKLLTTLQTYKSLGDYVNAKIYFDKYSYVDEQFATYREYILKVVSPRPMWVQPVLELQYGSQVVYKEFPSTHVGLIQSHLQRYSY